MLCFKCASSRLSNLYGPAARRPRSIAAATAATGLNLIRGRARYRQLLLPVPAQHYRTFTQTCPLMEGPFSREHEEFLHKFNVDRWGWVFYRTAYGDDEAWLRFKNFLAKETRKALEESNAPELANSLEWTFIEDRALLEGASKDKLRLHFRSWAERAITIENPRFDRARPFSDFNLARYSYFIEVDEEALRSIGNFGSSVNFIRANWEPDPDSEDDYEPVQGCKEEDVGWILLSQQMMVVESLDYFDAPGDAWYTFYVRPPHMLLS